MNTQQALELLDKAVAQVTTNRETHIALATAIDVIKKALAPKEDKVEVNE